MPFGTIEKAIEDIREGRLVIVADDEDRENEGDLIMAAHFVTADSINFMIKNAKGLVCVPVTDEILEQLSIIYSMSFIGLPSHIIIYAPPNSRYRGIKL